MKKLLFIPLLISAFVACEKVETEKKPTKRAMLTFESSTFSGGDGESDNTITKDWWGQYIDSPQYGGNLLYGGNGYAWYDNDTKLTSYLPDYWKDGTFFGGGIAISNYVENPQTPTYENQLTIGVKPVSGENFAVCYVATNDCPPFIEFKYGTGIVESLFITPTSYLNEVVQNGNAFSQAMTREGYIRVEATGIDAQGKTVDTLTMLLYDGRTFAGWRKWDLSALGVVKRIEFRMYEGEVKGGLRVDSTAEYPNFPFYFAVDNISVLL
jgi:hypothetical protein